MQTKLFQNIFTLPIYKQILRKKLTKYTHESEAVMLLDGNRTLQTRASDLYSDNCYRDMLLRVIFSITNIIR